MKTLLTVIVPVVKWLSIISGMASMAEMLPPKIAGYAVAAFAIVSALKDTLIKVGDMLDDGQRNDSFKA